MLYSLIAMTFIGTFFGLGIGKIMITLVFSIVGLLNAIHRKILPLTIIFVSIYLGSLIGNGNIRILPILLFYFFSLWLTKKIFKHNKLPKNKNFLRFFI